MKQLEIVQEEDYDIFFAASLEQGHESHEDLVMIIWNLRNKEQ